MLRELTMPGRGVIPANEFDKLYTESIVHRRRCERIFGEAVDLMNRQRKVTEVAVEQLDLFTKGVFSTVHEITTATKKIHDTEIRLSQMKNSVIAAVKAEKLALEKRDEHEFECEVVRCNRELQTCKAQGERRELRRETCVYHTGSLQHWNGCDCVSPPCFYVWNCCWRIHCKLLAGCTVAPSHDVSCEGWVPKLRPELPYDYLSGG